MISNIRVMIVASDMDENFLMILNKQCSEAFGIGKRHIPDIGVFKILKFDAEVYMTGQDESMISWRFF